MKFKLDRLMALTLRALVPAFLASAAYAQTWTQIATVGGPPPNFTVGVSDPARDLMIGFEDKHNLWVLSHADGLGGPSVWTHSVILQDPVQGFPLTEGFSAVYDPASNRIMTIGGCTANCGLTKNDVWILTNADGISGSPTWLKIFPGGALPPTRSNHEAVYDVANNRMIIFGGQDGCCLPPHTFSDTWVLTNANGLGGPAAWIQLIPTGGPPPANGGGSAVYDPANNRMVHFGGYPNLSLTVTNAVWVLTNANGLGGLPVWTNVIAEGAAGSPPARADASAVYDVTSNRMTIFAGTTLFGVYYNDTWVLTNANGVGPGAWTQLNPTGGPPPARLVAIAGLNAPSDRMTITGGGDNMGATTDTWVLHALELIQHSVNPPVIGTLVSNAAVSNGVQLPAFAIQGVLPGRDSVFTFTNTGVNVDPIGGGGDICINTYTFAYDEQLVSCCSCKVTRNALWSLSSVNDLLSNILTPDTTVASRGIVVKFLATQPVGGACNPASVGATTRGMAVWGTTTHLTANAAGYYQTETAATNSTLSPGEQLVMTSFCGFNRANGSGYGVCNSCNLKATIPSNPVVLVPGGDQNRGLGADKH